MSISLYEASVPNYLQTLGAVSHLLDTGLKFCSEHGIDPQTIVEMRLAPDMLPFRFQIQSVAHHSVGTIQALRDGGFGPPAGQTADDYAALQALVTRSRDTLKDLTPDDVNQCEGRDVVFRIGSYSQTFTATNFVMSFSLPNFYFHATTAYDILRIRGVPLGKRDFMGQMRTKA
jgi:hypothetical protein